MKTSEILDKAAAHIERCGWVQEDWYLDDGVTPLEECPVCAGGAINVAADYAPDYDEHDGTHEPVARAYEALARRIDPELVREAELGFEVNIGDFTEAVTEWNDSAESAEHVIAELRNAAAAERRAGR